MIATARNIAGLGSNPLRRFELETFARVTQLCGGSATMAQTLMGAGVGLLLLPMLVTFLVLLWRHVTREA